MNAFKYTIKFILFRCRQLINNDSLPLDNLLLKAKTVSKHQ